MIQLTIHIEFDLVRAAVLMFCADLTEVPALILWLHVLDDEAPLQGALVVVHADPGIRNKGEQTDGQRVLLILAPPCYLQIMAN